MSQKKRKLQTGPPRVENAGSAGSPGGNALTRREAEVLGWLAEGKRDGEIASILGISVHTVRKHVQNVFRKIGVENRTAAARFHVLKTLREAEPSKKAGGGTASPEPTKDE